MKTRYLALFLLACFASLPACLAQDAPPPPVKMGLWHSTVTTTMTGLDLPPEVAARLQAMGRAPGQPHTTTTLSCLTPEKWQKVFSRHDSKCQFTNQHQSASGLSADLVCTAPASGTGHMEMTFDSPEKMHGKTHMEVQSQRQPKPMLMDSTFSGDYQGADCKGISPDSPEIVK